MTDNQDRPQINHQLSAETATEEVTIAALTRRLRQIGERVRANIDAGEDDIYKDLAPADLNFVGFDSIELTPEMPQSERQETRVDTGEFFQYDDSGGGEVSVRLLRPDISDWGYDTPSLASAAINPSILETLRPDELLEIIETLHLMPGRPIQLCIDSVLGHCDFQGARLLETFDREPGNRDNLHYVNSACLRGPNVYGRDIDFGHPNVKSILLELLVRKLNLGFDCVRVDGARDLGDRGDTGDTVNCNTVYYGWRTSQDGAKQVFLIANMKGHPIARCPLNLFLDLAGEWRVAAHSPAMQDIPHSIDRNFVIRDFRNGQALLLERETPAEPQAAN